MKKLLVIAMLLCLVLCSVFAAKGDIKVGAQVGYGFDWTSLKFSVSDKYIKDLITEGGLYLVGTGSYNVADDVSIKAEIGINTMGKANLKVDSTIDPSESEDSTATDSTPVNFTAYLGGEYGFDVNDEISVGVGLGIDMMMGKQSANTDDKANGRIGVGMEAVGKYSINKQLEVSLGAKYSIYFINTGSDTEAIIPYMIKGAEETAKLVSGASVSHFQSGLKIFAGCTYAF